MGDAGTTAGTTASLLTQGSGTTISRNVTVQAAAVGTTRIGGSDDNNSTFGGLITLNRGVALTSAATTTGNSTTFSGQIIGAGGITKTGNGLVVLSNGTNSFSGGVTVTSGILRSTATGAIPSTATSSLTVNGGTLDLASNGNTTATTLNGTGGTINLASTLTVGSGNYAGVFSGTGTVAQAGAGTLTLSGNSTHSGGVTVTGNGSGTGGLVLQQALTTAKPLGTGTLNLNGGNVTISGGTNSLTANLYLATNRANLQNDNFPALQGGVYTLSNTANFTGTVTGNPAGLNYPQGNGADAQFTNVFGGTNPGGNNFTAIFTGYFRSTVAGTYSFQISGQDDNAAFWLDKDQSGTFDSAANERLIDAPCCATTNTATVSLAAGQLYKFAYAVEDTGGNSGLVASFQDPGGTMTVVNPSDPLQAGRFSTIAAVSNSDFSGNAVHVTAANSTVTLGTGTTSASYGDLTIDSTLGVGLNGTGTFNFNSTTGGAATSAITVTSGTNIGFNRSTSGTFASTIGGAGGLLVSGTGAVTVSGANTYTGNTALNSGSFVVGGNSSVSGGNITGPLGNSVVALAGGNLSTDSSSRTVLNQINISANSSLGTAAATSVLTLDGTSASKTVALSNNPVVTVNSPVTINSQITGTSNLTVSALERLSLANGANSYVGNTIVNGTLYATNTTGSATNTGNVTVNSGGILGGTGIIAPTGANITTIASGGHLDPHIGLTPSQLTINNGLTLAGGSILDFLVNTNGTPANSPATYDNVSGLKAGSVNGLLTFSSGGETLNLSGSINSGTYHLFSGFSNITGFGNLSVGAFANSAASYSLSLIPARHPPSAASTSSFKPPLHGPRHPIAMVFGTPQARIGRLAPAVQSLPRPTPSDLTTRQIHPTRPLSAIINGGVTPGSVTVAGSRNYTITSPDSIGIAGSGGITKTGSATLTLNGTNTFGGATSIRQGAITVNGDAALGNGGGVGLGDPTSTSSGTLNYNVSADIATPITRSFSAVTNTNGGPNTGGGTIDFNGKSVTIGDGTTTTGGIGGNGQLTIQNAGTVTFANPSNTISGSIVVTNATLAASSLGTTPATDATLTLNTAGFTETSTATAVSESRPVTVNTSGTISVTSATTNLSLTGGLTATALTKTGPGTLTLSTAATISGTSAVTGGKVVLGAASNSLTGSVAIATGTTLQTAVAGSAAGSLGTASMILNGGTLSLQGLNLSSGLIGRYFQLGGSPQTSDFSTLAALNNAFPVSGVGNPTGLTGVAATVTAPTTTGGNTQFIFDNGNTFNGNAPFASQGFNGIINYAVRFDGFFNAATAGAYYFDTRSDDGSVLYIDGNLVVNNNNYQGAVTVSGTTSTLTAGLHNITISYYQGGAGEGLQVHYLNGTTNLVNTAVSYSSGIVNYGNNVQVNNSSTIATPNATASLGNLSFAGTGTAGSRLALSVSGQGAQFSALNLTGGFDTIAAGATPITVKGTFGNSGATNLLSSSTGLLDLETTNGSGFTGTGGSLTTSGPLTLVAAAGTGPLGTYALTMNTGVHVPHPLQRR